VALNPDYYRPLLVRGFARRESGNAAGAILDLERSVVLLPTAEGYYGLGRAAQDAGRRDEAVVHYRKAASSQSQAGKHAGQRLARLDLPQNPTRYIAADLGLAQNGYLVVRVSNKSSVAVEGVRVVVGVRRAGGIREQGTLRIDRRLAAGQAVEVKTNIGPMNLATARGYAAAVSAARLAQ